MNVDETLKLLNIIIGDTAPHGSHGVDMDTVLPNIKQLGTVATELISELNSIAVNFENRHEASIQACGKEARYWIEFVKTEILEEDDE